MAEYKVTLASPLSLPADQRVRAGITVTKQYGYEGPLTDEQLTVEQVQAEKPARSETSAPTGSSTS